MIDVRKLRLLAALQRLGTIAAVAEEVHLSAPGVSMQITALEKELGIALTRRQGRRLTLTAAGSALANHGHDILGRLSLAELEVDALRAGTVGRYTLSAFPSAARTLVADAYRTLLSDAGSALDVHLTTAEPSVSISALAAGDVDLAVVHSYSNVPRDLPSSVDVRFLGSEPVWLAVSAPAHSAAATATLSDYASAAWIAPTSDVSCFDMMERACGLAGFRPRIVAESMDFAVQLELVAAGVGVALVPALTVAATPAGVKLLELDAPVTRSIHLVTRASDRADPGLANLAALLEQASTDWLSSRRLPS
ncbi:LysR substrate-binding domain-containing protein [Microbacterium galbinum]|uniref:LysR family transcriptional regulator n=1 Tax=Microbacterium galbinum TaxID=2851646 RepID=A0ABY4INW2_9MICO|nr:LysR substrate-binding domain-containing protein [Microbacterium galbinum]UPL14479.1 LysR family transcriptional regulator [Microbacterium galbinum]